MNIKSLVLSCALLLSASLFTACGGGTSSNQPPTGSDVPVAVTADVKARTFSLEKAGSIVFVFDAAAQQDMLDKARVTAIDSIDLRGSFNGWKNTGLTLTHSSSDANVWFIVRSLEDINVPGNSGQPEFKFVVTGTVDGTADATAWLDVSPTVPDGYVFSGNHIVVFEGDDLATIIANKAQADTVKTLVDFDQGTAQGRADLSNFRQVPGTSKLFRSYHPFKKSRPAMDTEAPRIALVNQLMEEQGVKSVITLSTLESPTDGETITPYLQAIMDNDRNLVLDVGYNLVYFQSQTAEFGNLIKSVVSFIVNPATEMPVVVHCRLGTDRTGVVAATLAALSGTPWDAIAADYQKSNAMGMQEFRDYKILQYSFEHMLQIPRGSIVSINLQQKMREYFIGNGYLTQDQADALVAKIL